MRVLLDECVDSRLAQHLKGVEAVTVPARGWSGITNGNLLALAQTEFEAFVTVDRNLSFQQHLPKYEIAVLLLAAKSNRIDDLVTLVPNLLKSLPSAPKGSVTRIGL